MTWNEDRERLIAAAELGDATPRIAADLLVAARKRAFEAEQAIRRVDEAYKAVADRLRSDLVQRTSERDTARDELKSLRYNLMAVTAQEQERTDQLALAESACRRDATALGVVQAELAAEKAAHAWIKTLERLPEETCDVLGIVDGVVTLLNYDEFEDDPFVDWSDGTFRGYSVDAVSHWMPLPEAPK